MVAQGFAQGFAWGSLGGSLGGRLEIAWGRYGDGLGQLRVPAQTPQPTGGPYRLLGAATECAKVGARCFAGHMDTPQISWSVYCRSGSTEGATR